MSRPTYKKAKAILAPIIDIPGFTWDVSTKKIQHTDYSLNIETLHAKYEPQHSQKIGYVSIKPLGLETITHHCTIQPHKKGFTAKLNLKDIFTEVTNVSLDNPQISTEENSISECVIEKDLIICDKLVLSFGDLKSDVSFTTDVEYYAYQINLNNNITAAAPEIYHTAYKTYPALQSEHPSKTLNTIGTNSLSDIILSRTYSSNSTQSEMQLQNALKTYGEFSYTNDLIKGLLSNVAIDNSTPVTSFQSYTPYNNAWYLLNFQEPIKITHFQPGEFANKTNTGGMYQEKYNAISIFSKSVDSDTSFATTFIHETGHYVMNGLFKNGCKPFTSSNLAQKNAYEEAELATFKNLGKQLGLPLSRLDPLDKVDDVIDEIKNTTLIELMAYFQSPSKSKDSSYVSEMRTKHGFSYMNDYLIDTKLFFKLLNSQSFIEVPSSEKLSVHIDIITQFTILMFDYPREKLEVELIIRIPHLLSENVPLSTLETYFKPLMNYWDNHITPQINTSFENHQEQCFGANTHVPECLPNYLDIYQQGVMV